MNISRTESKPRRGALGGWVGGTLIAAGLLAAAAAVVRSKTRDAEQQHPPIGQFVEVDGVRLHYVERGSGDPLLLLHGNGSMIEDLDVSGIIDRLAQRYRVIAFDRPGFGHSERPRDRTWTPTAQARLLQRALKQIGIDQAIVAGHSWGTLVALAMAIEYPASVKSLVLLSGYYYPSLRLDTAFAATPAIPVLGDLMRFTVSPLIGRLMWPLLKRQMFGPSKVPARFAGFPVWMALRPGQLRAAAAESGMMVPAAMSLSRRYEEIGMPVVLLAGDGDRIADARHNSVRLHHCLPHSHLRIEPGVGHMVHYLVPDQIVQAIEMADDAVTALQPVPASEHGAGAHAHPGRA